MENKGEAGRLTGTTTPEQQERDGLEAERVCLSQGGGLEKGAWIALR